MEFLKSISISLKEEGMNYGISPKEALIREMSNIEKILNDNQAAIIEPFARRVLELTKEFYSSIHSKLPKDYDDFSVIANEIITSKKVDLLAIHVPSIVS